MEFVELLDFNTVYLEKHNDYEEIAGDIDRKQDRLLEIIGDGSSKSLVYAGTYADIDRVAELVLNRMSVVGRRHLDHFALWLRRNYHQEWWLADLVARGVGVHNGRMHRCLS